MIKIILPGFKMLIKQKLGPDIIVIYNNIDRIIVKGALSEPEKLFIQNVIREILQNIKIEFEL